MTIQQMLLGSGGGPIYLTISATTTTSYDVFVSAGSPNYRADVILTINSGVYVGRGIDASGSWVSGSTLTIINNGYVLGVGGNGGDGGIGDYTANQDGGAGGNGASAIFLGVNLTIDNTNGYVFGGGGGGGGGAGGKAPPFGTGGGGGGGGGQSYVDAFGGLGGAVFTAGNPGQSGQDGSFSGPGAGGLAGALGGDGGNGGDWGSAGLDGNGPSGSGGNPGLGGTGGKAVELNGYSITWLGGNNASQVKGAVS